MSPRVGPRLGPRSGPNVGPNFDPSGGGPPAPQRAFPISAAAWAAAFPGIATPGNIWTLQNSSSPLLDVVGVNHLVENQALLYAQAGDPEPTLAPRLSVEFDTTAVGEFAAPADATVGNIALLDSWSVYVRFRCPDNGATSRQIIGKSTGAGARWILFLTATTGTLTVTINDGVLSRTVVSANAYDDGNYHDALMVVDRGGALVRLETELETASIAITTLAAVAPAVALHLGGGQIAVLATARASYMALWPTTALTAANLTTIRTPQ